MFPVRPETRLHEEIRFVPDLLPGGGQQRIDPRRDEEFMVVLGNGDKGLKNGKICYRIKVLVIILALSL